MPRGDAYTAIAPTNQVIPYPANVQHQEGRLILSGPLSIAAGDNQLLPSARVLAKHIEALTQYETRVNAQVSESQATIRMEIDETLPEHSYELLVNDHITLTGHSAAAVALAMPSVLQSMEQVGAQYGLPKMKMIDAPDYDYRAVMLDVARRWHPLTTLYETIDMMWYYKLNYLHLHLSDNRRVAFPLDKYPKLQAMGPKGERHYYTRSELEALVSYADARGIAIIPEIEVPGHSTQLWQQYPEVFGSVDSLTGEARSLYVVNMAKEKTYEAIEEIMQDLAAVFYTSPYIHIGCDEVYLEAVKGVPEYQAYCQKHNLQAAAEGDANELFSHFINRVNAMVKKTGKQAIAWEGFHATGAGSVTVDKDIKIIVWNTTYNHPQNLIDHGYTIINSTWVPLYLVGAMNLASPAEDIYQWDLNQWSHWNEEIADITLSEVKNTEGASLTYWEQRYYQVVPVLRDRIAAYAQRLWSNKRDTISFAEFDAMAQACDEQYGHLFSPITYTAAGVTNEEDNRFVEEVKIDMASSQSGQIKYAISPDWGLPDQSAMKVYTESVSLTNSAVVTAQLFDQDDQAIGYPTQVYYQKITPTYSYKVYGPAPTTGWTSMPDFNQLPVLRAGQTGRMTSDRLDKINDELFLKVTSYGHIDVRFQGLYNQYAVELKGVIEVEDSGEFDFRIQTYDGLADLYIDDVLVGHGSNFANEPEDFSTKLSKGRHDFTIHYYYRQIQNHLSILYKAGDQEDFLPFEDIVVEQ